MRPWAEGSLARAEMRRAPIYDPPVCPTSPEREARLHSSSENEPRLSIVTPCYNEEASLPAFMERMAMAARAAVGNAFEIVLVNDGSVDGSWACIEALALEHQAIVGVNLSRNHGHQLAVTAGLTVARGGRVLVIDADLQDPPELLAEMMALMDRGYDVVYGKRRVRGGESPFKLASAKLFYRLLHSISEVEIPLDTGDFRLMTRRIVDRLNEMPEHDRFLRGMIAWLGGRQVALLYDRDARREGKTAYSLSKMIRLAVDGLVGFSTAPLRAAVVLAGFGAGIGALIAAYVLVGFMAGHPVRGWTSLALVVVFFGVSQLGCLAIIGAYVGRIYMQGKSRPLYMIDEVMAGRSAHMAGNA